MTLNDLIRQCTAIAQQLSSGDVPLKCYGEEVDVEMWVGKDDDGKHYIHTYLVGAGNAEHSKILKRIENETH